jgi:AAA domain (dynein-related subfamily)
MQVSESFRLALRAIHSIFNAAAPLELDIAGKAVTVGVSREPAEWPAPGHGLEEETDGPWPASVVLACDWEVGRVDLTLSAGPYNNDVGISLRVAPRRRLLVWISLCKRLSRSEGDAVVAFPGTFALNPGKAQGAELDALAEAKVQLKALVSSSSLPLLTKTNILAFQLQAADGAVLPSPAEAFIRLVQLALYKLDFMARGPRAAERGEPLIRVDALAGVAEGEDSEEEFSDERSYWAGGFQWGPNSQLERFLEQSSWALGWDREAPDTAAKTAWRRFEHIQIGDLFAIKGYGGTHDLRVHLVGEVAGIDPEHGRLELRPMDVELYRGKAPRGAGAGNWHDSLLRVSRPDDLRKLFGVSREEAGGIAGRDAPELPLNMILYGPPGTGKTYALQDEYLPLFTDAAGTPNDATADPDALADLSWFQVLAIALHKSGGETTAPGLREHPLVIGKYATKTFRAPLLRRIWSVLQSHAVQSSEFVRTTRRTGALIFDKRADGTWYLPDGLPDDLTALAEDLLAAPSVQERRRFAFVTFHQAYGYEDFIEGIRPKTVEDETTGASLLAYELEDGIFRRAVDAAIRLTGFAGPVHEFCALSRDERAHLLEGVPRYAVFVDEINRGNVARILGELITLLEPSKRLGEPEELIVTLPYSGLRFGVPSNLHMIGTMNTADRSVEALDTALRRRFAFRECPPRPELLDALVDGNIDPGLLLRRMNERLLKLLDRDHQIGHAYFMPLLEDPSLDRLKQIFRDAIIPLLQEYFYGDWGRIGLVLGRDFVRRHDASSVVFANFDHDDAEALGDRPTFELAEIDSLSSVAFQQIYAHASSDDSGL